MKRLYTLIFLLAPLFSFAQNYQCVSPNTIRYFTNTDHNLRGIRIDSTKQVNSNTVLYPYKTARGTIGNMKYTLRPMGSWLGETITIQPDGTHMFDTYWGDTIVIRSQAQLNDSWIFIDDTSSIYYEATVSSIDTLSVLGSIDSVKTITLTAKDANGIVASDPFHNKRILLSKDHGFVSVFNLYMFPHIGSKFIYDHSLFITKLTTDIEYSLVDLYIPTQLEVYDYTVGDEYQYKSYYYHDKNSLKEKHSDIILSKNVSATEVEYAIKRTIQYYETPSSQYPTGRTVVKPDTIIRKYSTNKLLDLTLLPEEWGMGQYIHYNPTDTQMCTINRSYSIEPNYVYYAGDSALLNTFEPCSGPYYRYKIGFGELYYAFCYVPNGGQANPTFTMTYAKNQIATCGQYYPVSINSISNVETKFDVYPNPASNELHISTSSNEQVTITLKELTGKTIYNTTTNSSTSINTSNYANGIYILTTSTIDGKQEHHKVVIGH